MIKQSHRLVAKLPPRFQLVRFKAVLYERQLLDQQPLQEEHLVESPLDLKGRAKQNGNGMGLLERRTEEGARKVADDPQHSESLQATY
jgi:hypothetical protein